jgi:NAD(P)-dependent dehydrogenase (short-subunit alcohol dehydrogenase family)
VVNNAGTRRPNPVDRMTHDDFAAVVDTHLLGSFHVSQAAFEPMRRAGYGRLIFVGSSIGTFGNAGLANYAAAKAGIVGLANVFAIEGAQFGVTANTILPLAVTARSTAAHAAQTLGAQLAASSAAERQYDPDGQPLTWPDEVAPVVVALASRSCPFTRRVFTYGYGRLAEVFVGVTRGWYPQAPEAVTPEDVLGHIAEVEDRDGYVVPLSFTEEKNWIRALAPDA